MANLPSQYPNLSIHLTDRDLTPLVTSARSPQQLQSLSSVSQTALLAHEAASRLGLGSPQRLMVEHASNGPVLLHTFITPGAAPPKPATNGEADLPAEMEGLEVTESEASDPQPDTTPTAAPQDQDQSAAAPPMLLSTVAAPSADLMLESRRAAVRLERVGREVQAQIG